MPRHIKNNTGTLMLKKIIMLLVILQVAFLRAEFAGNKAPSMIYGSGNISFGINSPPNTLCEYWGRYLTFDATTVEGKNMLTILLSAKMAGKNIDVWFLPSTVPGTTQANGCTRDSLGVLTQIGIAD
jgi:hypothetical protein